MKETPIIMTGDSPRAILEGRKTQTRRVIKPQPEKTRDAIGIDHKFWQPRKGVVLWDERFIREAVDYCPYGQVGDRLWVKETWARDSDGRNDFYIYKADGTQTNRGWKSPRFMPKVASRILLEITDIRVERLQEITIKDAIREGFCEAQYPVKAFATLWDSLNAKRGYSWETNPWVWVITFRQVK